MNTQLNKVTGLLTKHGYKRNRTETIKEPYQGDIMMEWWSGSRGTIIFQWEKGQPGVQTFADWPLGSTFDELEAALSATITRGSDRCINVKGALWDSSPCEHTYDLNDDQPNPKTLDEARKMAGDFESLAEAELVRNDWVLNTTTTVTNLK